MADRLIPEWQQEQGVEYKLRWTEEDIQDFIYEIPHNEYVSLDTETTGLDTEIAELVGISLCHRAGEAIYIPVGHTNGVDYNVALPIVERFIRFLLQNNKILFYNADYDGDILFRAFGIDPRSYTYEDVRISAYLANPNEKNQGLKNMALKYLGIKMLTYEEMLKDQKIKEAEATGDLKLIRAANKKSKKASAAGSGFQVIHPEDARPYACADADLTYRLFFLPEFQAARTARVFPDGRTIDQSGIYRIENRLIEVLRTQKKNRVLIDLPYLESLQKIMEKQIADVKVEIFRKAGKTELELDIDSPKQLAQLLYKDLGLKYKDPYKKNPDGSPIYQIPVTKKGAMSTDASVLEWMAKETSPAYSIVKDILEYRGLYKALSTYILPLKNGLNESSEGKFNYNPYAAPTGRLAAGSVKLSKNVRPGGYMNFNVHSVPKNYKKEIVYCAKTPVDDPGNLFHFKSYDGKIYCLGLEPKGIALALEKYEKRNHTDTVVPEFEFIVSNTKKTPEKCEVCTSAEVEWGWFDISEHMNIRRAFKARPGFKLVAIDYSQIELRIAAAISGEPMWVTAFKNNEDVHEKTSLEMLGSKEKALRTIAKQCNFGLIYLGTAGTLARQIKCSMDIAKAHFVKWRATVPVYCKWAEDTAKFGRDFNYVNTEFGRVRPIPKAWFEADLKGFGERSSVNTIVQGTAADILKFSLNKLDKLISSRNWLKCVKILLNIHDEVLFEVKEEMVKEVVPELVQTMEYTIRSVVLKAEAEVGENWGELISVREYNSPNNLPPKVEAHSTSIHIGASVLDKQEDLDILMREIPVPLSIQVQIPKTPVNVSETIQEPRPKISYKFTVKGAEELRTYFTQECPGTEDYEFDLLLDGQEVSVRISNVDVSKIKNDTFFSSLRKDNIGKIFETNCKFEEKKAKN